MAITLLWEFAIDRPEAVLGYSKRESPPNATHDYFKHRHSQSSGGENWHVSTIDVDPEAGRGVYGSSEDEDIARKIFLMEIDEHLKRCLYWAGSGTRSYDFLALLPAGNEHEGNCLFIWNRIGTKGLGSVIERLKRCVLVMREHIIWAVAWINTSTKES